MDSLGAVQYGKKWHRSLWKSVSGYSSPVCLFLNSLAQIHMRIFLLEGMLATVLLEVEVVNQGTRGLSLILRCLVRKLEKLACLNAQGLGDQ